MFEELILKLSSEIFPLVYKLLLIFSPVIVPIVLISIFIRVWINYVQIKYIKNSKPFLYEIKIPKDIQKSPLAMEIILNSMSAGGASNYTEAYLQGKVMGWFSLEIVSIEGQIRFFIWSSESKFKDILPAQIYAQYPSVEVNLVNPNDDYVKKFQYDPNKKSIYGVQFALTKPDVYPIKTYIDYGLDKDQKDEYRIDPMTAVLELMGTIGVGQQLWMQILIKKHGKEGIFEHRFKEKKDWKGEASQEIEKIRQEATPKSDGEEAARSNPTKGQTEKINAIERSLSKMPFYSAIRCIYLADKDKFNSGFISGMMGSMRQYSSESLNGFKPKFKTDVSDSFKDWCTIFPFLNSSKNKDIEGAKMAIFNAYRLRSYFYPPYKHLGQDPFVLNVEELATIYHFPGNVSATPTLSKIPSKKSEAPVNLPIKN